MSSSLPSRNRCAFFFEGPANSADRRGVNPRFEYAWQSPFSVSSRRSFHSSPPLSSSTPFISLNPHSGLSGYEINSHSELPLMLLRVSLTIPWYSWRSSPPYTNLYYAFLVDSLTVFTFKRIFSAVGAISKYRSPREYTK